MIQIQYKACAVGVCHCGFIDHEQKVWVCGYNNKCPSMDAAQKMSNTERAKYCLPLSQIISLPPIKAIALGRLFSIFLDMEGAVWYDNLSCQPKKLSSIPPIQDIVAGDKKSFLLDFTGKVWAQNEPRSEFVSLRKLPEVQLIFAGDSNFFFVVENGSVWGCGENRHGSLGVGKTTKKEKPTLIRSLSNIVSIGSSIFHTLFVDKDGSVWSCGSNIDGQLGHNADNKVSMSVPTRIETLPPITDVAAGYEFSLFLDKNGAAWGCGRLSQFGILDRDVAIPTPVATNLTFSALVARNEVLFMIDMENNVWASGVNNWGQLGLGSTSKREYNLSRVEDLPALYSSSIYSVKSSRS